MEKKEKVIYAFIDSQNVNIGINAKGWKLDWGKFRLFLRNKYKVSKAFLFIGYIESNSQLYKHLQEVGFILIFKNVLAVKKGSLTVVKGNVDAELVLNCMLQKDYFDKAIIVSGDGDFYCLIEYLEKNKLLEKIITPNQRYSSLIRKYSNYIISISSLRKKLEYINNKERHSRGKQG